MAHVVSTVDWKCAPLGKGVFLNLSACIAWVPCSELTRTLLFSQVAQEEDGPKFMYYVNDGVYGSFNCLLYDHATVDVKVPPIYVPSELHRASIWGPTCDGIDCISAKCWLPEMDSGQWLIFEDMGAYTCAASSTFNGFSRPGMFYVAPQEAFEQVRPTTCGMTRTTSASTDEGVSLEDHLMKEESVTDGNLR